MPELDEENNCFVIQGGVTVSVEDLESGQKVIEILHNSTKDTMEKDELLTDDNPEVEDVRFLEEEEDDDILIAVPPKLGEPGANGGPKLPLILGATFGFLALFLGASLLRHKRGKFAEGIVAGAGAAAAAPSGLQVHAATMDVHECKSAACPKCYQQNQGVKFVNAPPTPRPPPANANNGIPSAWVENSSLESSSFESSSTTEFYS